jgi:hypothetical protein
MFREARLSSGGIMSFLARIVLGDADARLREEPEEEEDDRNEDDDGNSKDNDGYSE